MYYTPNYDVSIFVVKSLKLYIKHYVIKTKVVRHKNKNQFGLMKYPYTKTIHLDLQTRIHHSLVLVIRSQ